MKKNAWMWLLFSSVCVRVVSGDADHICVRFSLEEEEAGDDFASDLQCDQDSFEAWQHSNYAEAAADGRGVPLPHGAAEHHLAAVALISCSRTERRLRVRAGGELRVECYVAPAPGTMVSLLVQLLTESQGGVPFGSHLDIWNDPATGWINFTVPVDHDGDEVYVMFTGVKQEDESMILIDSFKYAHSEELLAECEMYPDNTPPNSNEVTDPEPCVAFNLEGEEAEEDFASDLECDSYDPWQYSNYDAVEADGVPRPHGAAEHHLAAVALASCSRTKHELRVSAGGLLRVECFVRPAPGTTVSLTVRILSQIQDDVGFGSKTEIWDEDADGWFNITVPVLNDGYDVYVAFIGEKEEESILIIDSYTYFYDEDQLDTCELYSGPETTPIPEESCVTFNLEEEEASADFASDFECETSPFDGWQHSSYSEAADGVPRPHGAAEHRLAAAAPGSCSRTVRLLPRVARGGLLRVECYVRAAPGATVALTVLLASELGGGPLDAPHVSSWDENNATDWHNITVPVTTDGHQIRIVFVGVVPNESILQIDSFSYVDSEDRLETCEVYDSDADDNPSVPDPGENSPAPGGDSSWLNALIIAIVTIVGLVVLIVVGFLSYKLGQRRAVKHIPPPLHTEDVDLPPTVFVPRVTRAYNYPRNNDFRKN